MQSVPKRTGEHCFLTKNMIIAQYGIRRAKNLCELRGAGTVKDVWCVPLTILLILMLVACSPADSSSSSGIDENGQEGNRSANSLSGNSGTEGKKDESEMSQNVIYLSAGNETFAVALEDNDAANALMKLLQNGSVTISLNDYGGFEKVGALGTDLPADDAYTTTQAGDIVLYQGNQIVIFYGSNTWSYTRLGKINETEDLQAALGKGTVSVTFSLTEKAE